MHHNEDGALEAIQEQRLRGKLKHRVSYEAGGELLEAMISNGMESGFGDEWIRLGATAEHAVDGSLSERTMAMRQPYIGLPASYHGNLTETQEDLNAWCERVHRAHIQLNCHANGDVAIDRTLTAYERALKLYPRANARPKITHCSQVNPDLIRRMKAMDVVPSVFSTYPYYNSDKFHFYGQETMQHMIAFRTLLDAGIKAAAGSDFGPGPFSPLMAIQAMVTRTGWNGETWGASQKITLDEAIQVNTINGAYNSREEKDKGSITAGKLADFLVLAEDLHSHRAVKDQGREDRPDRGRRRGDVSGFIDSSGAFRAATFSILRQPPLPPHGGRWRGRCRQRGVGGADPSCDGWGSLKSQEAVLV